LTLWTHTINAVSGSRNESAHLNRGQEFLKRGNYAAAIADYNTVLTLNPLASDAWLNRGIALQNLGELAGAQRDFEEALRLDPANLRALFARALLNIQLGSAAQAQKDLSFLLSRNFMPSDVIAAQKKASEIRQAQPTAKKKPDGKGQ
ncbi:MAG TPA: tetratricopeptide repeat protein, partial [Elusimicrobiales bacterium]|nr:tetratricopeptide repeat protein [Elusimicrobiales bacterium]